MRKKILIINPVALFPIEMASQDRVVKMVERLNSDHDVDVLTLVKTKKDIVLSKVNLIGKCHEFIPVKAINYNSLMRKPLGLVFIIANLLFGISKRKFYWGNVLTTSKISKIIAENDYDIVQVEHWYQSSVLNTSKQFTKVISSHDVLFKKKEKEFENAYKGKMPFFKKRELKIYKVSELNAMKLADISITVSLSDKLFFEQNCELNNLIYVPIGQNIEYFSNFPSAMEENNVLFYGNLSSLQNIEAFKRLFYQILPLVRKEIPSVRITIVGANPPTFIKELNDNSKVVVTGYVEDVRPFISKCTVLAIPLELGGGFRGRIIDVMAMGIPVVGTHNALDCIQMSNGKQGFIVDDNSSIANAIISICLDSQLRDFLRNNCLEFVKKHYSIENTYGSLSNYYSNL